jgi:hypothetical protein
LRDCNDLVLFAGVDRVKLLSSVNRGRERVGDINLSRGETEALKGIDVRDFEQLLEQAIFEVRSGVLHHLPLASCGPYVSSRLRRFDQAIAEQLKAKAAKKRADAAVDVRRAGMALLDAVRDMQDRVRTEEEEGQLFHIDDLIRPPHSFGSRLDVRVNYRWRTAVDDKWTFAGITFHHDVDLRPDYIRPPAKRKPSAAQQRMDEQDELFRIWDQLKSGALYSVRDYLKSGADRTAIPETFQATIDRHGGGLNNYSTQFWREQ